MKVLVAGAGWAGLACAVALVKIGHHVTLIESTRTAGGRARSLSRKQSDGTSIVLDNGQHILIGAYSETLSLMRQVGLNPSEVLLRLPLSLRFPDGDMLRLPDWTHPPIKGLDVVWGICRASGWSWADKLSLLRAATRWRLRNFSCDAQTSVATLCRSLTPPVMQMLIEPLCVSALNTPAQRASAQVFLRVLGDSLFAPSNADIASSNLLLPKVDLAHLLPIAAISWLEQHGASVRLGQRLKHIDTHLSAGPIAHIAPSGSSDFTQNFDALVIATPPQEAQRISRACGHIAWADCTQALKFEAITTVYAHAPQAKLPCPIMALKSSPAEPAQFVFDRGALTNQAGLLAFVVSASSTDVARIEQQVIEQGRKQLSLPQLQALQSITEKRASFACTPHLERPPARIAPRIIACGDYIQGPYPSTLEGAVRSGIQAAALV